MAIKLTRAVHVNGVAHHVVEGMMPKDTGHGGRRPGAGRRATDTDETLTPYTLTLRLTDVGALNRIGEGNLSRGLRRLIDRGNAAGLIPPRDDGTGTFTA